MAVRFFNDYGPDNQPRLLIGIAYDEEPVGSGQAREAVRPATEADVAVHANEYQVYQASFTKEGKEGQTEGKPLAPMAPTGSDPSTSVGATPAAEPHHETRHEAEEGRETRRHR